MKQINRWAVATSGGGEWHLELSRQLFTDYEEAATRALELYGRGTGYFYKPVQVAVSPAQQGGIASEDSTQASLKPHHWESGELVIDTRPSYMVQDDCECLDDHGTYTQTYCMGCAALLSSDVDLGPVAVEPWDGLFVGGSLIWKLDSGIADVVGSTTKGALDVREVWLDGSSVFDAALGGYVA